MSLRNVIRGLRKEIDELYNRAQRGAWLQAAADHSAGAIAIPGTNLPAATTPGGGDLIVAAALAVVRFSGVFEVELSANYTGATAADTIVWKVQTQDSVAPIVLANNTQIGSASALDPQPIKIYTNNGHAGGITVASGGGDTIDQYTSGTQIQPTGGTTGGFDFAGRIGSAQGVPSGFAAGQHVMLYLSTSVGADSMTWTGLSFRVRELLLA